MDKILELAESLGKEIAQHERFIRFRRAEEAVAADEAANGIRKELEAQAEKIAQLQDAGRPIEPDDKRRLQELRDKTHANALLQELARAQADYMELMSKINRTMRDRLYPPE